MLIDTAQASELEDLYIAEEGGVLHINGTTPRADVKNKLWDIYNQIDPNYLSGDVLMNVSVSKGVENGQVRVITKETNLNVRKGPGTEQPVIGTAEKGEIITLISCSNDQWWLVRLPSETEGYCYSQYLEPVE